MDLRLRATAFLAVLVIMDSDHDANGYGAIGLPDFSTLGRLFGRAPGPSAFVR